MHRDTCDRGVHDVDLKQLQHPIAQAVVEGTDATAVERQLRGLDEACAIGHLAEIPALADELNTPAGGPINGALHRCAHSGKGIRYWQVIPQVLGFKLHGLSFVVNT